MPRKRADGQLRHRGASNLQAGAILCSADAYSALAEAEADLEGRSSSSVPTEISKSEGDAPANGSSTETPASDMVTLAMPLRLTIGFEPDGSPSVRLARAEEPTDAAPTRPQRTVTHHERTAGQHLEGGAGNRRRSV